MLVAASEYLFFNHCAIDTRRAHRSRSTGASRRRRGTGHGLDAPGALRGARRHRREFTTIFTTSLVPRADGRPVAGGATQFAATHAKASYLELVPGYGRSGEKTINDGVLRRDLAQFLAALDDQDRKLTHIDVIDCALDHAPDLHTPGDSVEAKVITGDRVTSWNHKASIERADEVNALVVTYLPRLASETARTIILAAPALKYAADIHLLHALGDKTKYDDFAIVDEKPIGGVLGPGGVHQVALRTRSVTQRDFRTFPNFKSRRRRLHDHKRVYASRE